MLDRRSLLAGGGAAFAAGGVRAAQSEEAERVYRGALAVDTLTIDMPGADAEAALKAGMDAAVVDLAIYPRGPEEAQAMLVAWNTALTAPDARMRLVKSGGDFEAARRAGKFGVVLASQDAGILGPSVWSVGEANLDVLRDFHALGLRVLQLTHNERNGVGDGFRERTDAGLSLLGEGVVDEMNRLRMLVDLSHCSDQTTLQAIRRSKRPCAVTHAGCRALYDSRRNKTDEAIRALAERGGFFGVYMMSRWLTKAPSATADAVVDHIDHAVKVGGMDLVGFGSDQPLLGDPSTQAEKMAGLAAYNERNKGLPGAEPLVGHATVAEMDGPDRMVVLTRALARRGYKQAAIEKILGGNFVRTFTAACG